MSTKIHFIILLNIFSITLSAQSVECDFYTQNIDELPTFKSCDTVENKIDCTTKKIEEILANNFKGNEFNLNTGEKLLITIQIDENGAQQESNILKRRSEADIANSPIYENDPNKNLLDEERDKLTAAINLFPEFNPAKKEQAIVCSTVCLWIHFEQGKLMVEQYEYNVARLPFMKGCEDIEDSKERKDCSNQKIVEHLSANVECPKKAMRKGIVGKTVVKFMVDKDGSIQNVKSVVKLGHGIDEEARRIISELPPFAPGMQYGKNVRVYFNLPINFNCN